MPTYGNQQGSSIKSYEITDEGINITFKNGQTYKYEEGYNDSATLEIMKELAESGSGLNSFIRKENPSFS